MIIPLTDEVILDLLFESRQSKQSESCFKDNRTQHHAHHLFKIWSGVFAVLRVKSWTRSDYKHGFLYKDSGNQQGIYLHLKSNQLPIKQTFITRANKNQEIRALQSCFVTRVLRSATYSAGY